MKSKLFQSRYLLATLFTSTIMCVSVDSFTIAGRSEIDSEEIPVRVELVNRKRVRRHISPLSTTPDFEYHLKISSDSDHSDSSFSYDLNLQPLPHSVFSSAFKYTEFGTDESGNSVTHSFVPSREELDLIESKLYTDKDTNSFVKLEHEDDGDLELYGVVNRARIRTRRDAGTGKNSFSMKHPNRVSAVDVTPPDLHREDMQDVVEVPLDVSVPSRRSGRPVDLNAWVNIEPELALVFDYQMAQDIGGDWNQKLEYAAITVNGINGYYEVTNDSIRIKCELVHVMAIKSEAEMQWLTNLNGTRVEMGDGKWAMNYNGTKVSTAYRQWVFQHAEEIGKYDIAPIMMGVSFGNTLGLAVEGAACLFSVQVGKDPTSSSLATPANSDLGANFEGIPVLAHEIGHNLGSRHDGDPGKEGVVSLLGSSEACPFGWGFLMGYNRHNFTNSFRLTKCSLDAIKAYVTLDVAACLRPDNKTGRPIIHTSVRQGGSADHNPYSRNKGCSRWAELNFQGVASYQTADFNCRYVKCEVKEGDQEKHSFTSLVPARDTPCGDNHRKGKCRNGWCIGQGPAVDMDSVCKIATRYADSEFDSETTPLDQICKSRSWWCSDAGGRAREFKNIIVAHGTPCGEAKVCLGYQCIEKDQMKKDHKDCILQTGKIEAQRVQFQHPNPKCAGLVKCTFGTEIEFIGTGSTDPDCNPAAASPGSLSGRGGDDSDQAPSLNSGDGDGPGEKGAPSAQKGRTLQDVCDERTKEIGSKVEEPVATAESDRRNELCSNLVCIAALGTPLQRPVSGAAPDGTICGPLRRCITGKCVKCGSSSSSG